jgi:H+/Cl- antiporter ClcA
MGDVAAAGGSALVGGLFVGLFIGALVFLSHLIERLKRKLWKSKHANLSDAEADEAWLELQTDKKKKSQRVMRYIVVFFVMTFALILYLGIKSQKG